MDNQFEELFNKVNEVNMFAVDKIENLEVRIKDLEKLAKETRKGENQSHIFAKIDKLEAELTAARREAGVNESEEPFK